MKRFAVIIVGMTVFLLSMNIQAMEPLVIVTAPWPPFALEEGQNITGTDVEIVREVFAKLEIPITVKSYPWKRCLHMVKQKEADAILDASVTPERKTFLTFPDEPVSEGTTVFFVKKGRRIPFTDLRDLNGLRAGALLGYTYCEEIDTALFMKNVDRVAALETNFKILLLDRIDFLIEVDAVGYFTAKTMGISDQIEIIPDANYCRGGNYLAFAKKPGHDRLAAKFGKALRIFKTTKNHRRILRKYGVKEP